MLAFTNARLKYNQERIMLRWLNSFTDRDEDKYFKLGGPRSFHKFKYKNVDIILIGEVHENMPPVLANQYLDIMNQFCERKDQVKIFIETTASKKCESSSDGVGFIDLMKRVRESENIQVVAADQRRWDKAFIDIYLFISHVEDIERGIMEAFHEKNKAIPNSFSFFHENEFVELIRSIPIKYEYNVNYKLKDLYEFVASQIEILDKAASGYLEENKLIGQWIAHCLLQVNEGMEKVLNLEAEYIKLRSDLNETEIENMSVIDICTDMIIKSGTFKPAKNWLEVISLYVTSFLDATLTINIWEEIKISNDVYDKAIFVVSGDEHASNLACFLKLICESSASIYANRDGKIIPPDILSEYLSDNYEHSQNNEICRCM